jgi:hypothetical protein
MAMGMELSSRGPDFVRHEGIRGTPSARVHRVPNPGLVMKSFVYEYLSVSYGGVKFVMPVKLVALRDR